MIHHLTDGTELYYEVHGKENSDFTIVFLNGLSQSTFSWAGISPTLAQESKIILLDSVFQGKSGAPEDFRTFDAHAADLYELLQSLKATNIILAGISYGSAIAQHALVNYPHFFRGAILISTFAHSTPVFDAIGASWKAALRIGDYPLLLDVMLPTVLGRSYFENPLIPVQALKEMRIGNQLKASSLLKLMRATETRGDYRQQLKNIKVPVLVIQGEEDMLIPPVVAREVADHISGAKFEIIKKAGHTLNLEAIPQLIILIREFRMSLENKTKS
ncbi:MAG TPA: alpha/beta hydrolase [Bacteroidia bacterium]|nr:alpha/beta hydrolase [Bacteroidia bacterium]